MTLQIRSTLDIKFQGNKGESDPCRRLVQPAPHRLRCRVLAAPRCQVTTVIGATAFQSQLIRFVQERRLRRAAERLRAMVSNASTVLRPEGDNPAQQVRPQAWVRGREVPMRTLMTAGLVLLSADDMNPARVLAAEDLIIVQAAMTGESLPVEKLAEQKGDGKGALEQSNLASMGTDVVSGASR
jgi:Mg2+-importing ATPase